MVKEDIVEISLVDEGFPHLLLSSDGTVFNTITDNYLTISNNKFQIWQGGKNNRRSVGKLLRKYFINNEIEMRDIPGFEGLYATTKGGGVYSYFNRRFLSPGSNGRYLGVILSKDLEKKRYLVHRLVAICWIPNPNNLPQVNHKDEDKENNHDYNLEWCDAKYNINYGDRTEKMLKTRFDRHGY